MLVEFLDGEVFYPVVSEYAKQMPYDVNTNEEVFFENNPTYNQMMPLLLSNMGRVIYQNKGFIASFCAGKIEFNKDVQVISAGDDLKSAYQYCVKHIFASDTFHIHPDLIIKPIYNTWMFCPVNINQEEVLRYAQNIQYLKMDSGTLIIDDKWEKNYGDYQFDSEKFPDVKLMIQKLHEMNFNVMVWISPYISFSSDQYAYLKERDLLLKENTDIYRLTWWNETSACLDLRKDETKEYIHRCLDKLMDLGIDGFKMDGGDSIYYLPQHEPDLQSHLWASIASDYEFNEIRSSYHNGGMSIYNRLSDKQRVWTDKGIAGLVPGTLALSLMAQPFSSPDMIGGGEVKDLLKGIPLDEDIYLAHLQNALLLPSVQFSILPDKVLKDVGQYNKLWSYRKRYGSYINEVFLQSMKDKSPMVRLLEYEFPHQGLEKVIHQFMFGDKLLVAPVYKQNQNEMRIHLPKGNWKYKDSILQGGRVICIDCCLDDLIVLERQDI